MGRRPRLVVVAVPEPRRGDEGPAGLPVDPLRFDDGAVGVEGGADQAVAARAAVDDEVEGDALVPVRSLEASVGEDAEHGPQSVGGGEGLGVTGVAEEDSHATASVGPRFGRHRRQPGPGPLAVEEGGEKRAPVGSTPR